MSKRVKVLFAVLFVLLFAVFFCQPCLAQTSAPPTGTTAASAPSTPIFSTETDAIAIRIGGTSNAGTDIVGKLHVTPNLSLESHSILAPGIDFQMYAGGARYDLGSRLSTLVSKTSIPPGMLNPYVRGFVGVVRNVPASGPTLQHIGYAIGGGVDFRLNQSGAWSAGPSAYFLSAQGFGPSPHGVIIGANVTFVLWQKKQ